MGIHEFLCSTLLVNAESSMVNQPFFSLLPTLKTHIELVRPSLAYCCGACIL